MNDTERSLRQLAERMEKLLEKLQPGELDGKEHLVMELEESIKELGSLYESLYDSDDKGPAK